MGLVGTVEPMCSSLKGSDGHAKHAASSSVSMDDRDDDDSHFTTWDAGTKAKAAICTSALGRHRSRDTGKAGVGVAALVEEPGTLLCSDGAEDTRLMVVVAHINILMVGWFVLRKSV